MHELLQVVEVDSKDRVRCCAPNCHRSVYKRIHVVRDNGQILVLGETCYKLLYKDAESTKSSYFTHQSRKLSEEERRLLIENTEALINWFEQEHQLAVKESFAQTQSRPPISQDPHCPRYERKVSMPVRESEGEGRRVSCNYCGSSMLTQIAHVPAKGFKCARCKADNVSLPLTNAGRTRTS